MPAMIMKHDIDPKEAISAKVGDLSSVDVFFSNILIGIYVRPNQTKSGILLTDQTRDEDQFQGKVGLVLKKGPMAFKDSADVGFDGQDVNVGDWVVIRASDGWSLTVHGQICRMVSDTGVKLVVADPDEIW